MKDTDENKILVESLIKTIIICKWKQAFVTWCKLTLGYKFCTLVALNESSCFVRFSRKLTCFVPSALFNAGLCSKGLHEAEQLCRPFAEAAE